MTKSPARSVLKLLALILSIMCPCVQSCTSILPVRNDITANVMKESRPECDSVELILKDGQRRCFARESYLRTDSSVVGICMQYDSSGQRLTFNAEYDSVHVSRIQQVNCIRMTKVSSPEKTIGIAVTSVLIAIAIVAVIVSNEDFHGLRAIK